MLMLALLGLGLTVALVASGSSHPSPPGSTPGMPPGPLPPPPLDASNAGAALAASIAKASPVKIPDGVQQAIAQALASKDVAKMGAVAQQLAKNYPFAADQLKGAASAIAKSVMTGAPPVVPVGIA